MQADITVVSLNHMPQQPVRDPVDALVFSSSASEVLLTMVAGKEIYHDGRMSGVDESEFRKRLEQVRAKTDSTTET